MPSVVWWGRGGKRGDERRSCWCCWREGGLAKKRALKLTQEDHRFLGARLAIGQELVAQAGSGGSGAHVAKFRGRWVSR